MPLLAFYFLLFLIFVATDASAADTVTLYEGLWVPSLTEVVVVLVLLVIAGVMALWWASGTIRTPKPRYQITHRVYKSDLMGHYHVYRRSTFGRWVFMESFMTERVAKIYVKCCESEDLGRNLAPEDTEHL